MEFWPLSLKPSRQPADGMLMTDLERTSAELRAAVILVGKRIVKLNFGRRNDPVLPILRRVLRESRSGVRSQQPILRSLHYLVDENRAGRTTPPRFGVACDDGHYHTYARPRFNFVPVHC